GARRGRDRGRGLVLIGGRGTGKSTVGRLVAERAGRPFVDSDREIERRSGRSIRAIFEESGEPTFRDWEQETLAQLAAEVPGAVLATGGGAVLREANRDILRGFGLVAWLTANPAEMGRRLQADRTGLAGRPALTPAGTLDEIVAVLAARGPLYAGLADVTIATDDLSPTQVAEALLAHWPGESSPC
ncbi:MAG: shikimate kinase, partial [Isosphaeraceae bacterium]